MRLVGYRTNDEHLVGVLTPDGRVARVTTVDSFYANIDHWTKHAADYRHGELELADLNLAPAVSSSARVFCVGLNYRAHATESAMKVEPYPTIFGRWTSSLSTDGAPVPLLDERLDWEGELAVVIGAPLASADTATARAAVFGYAPFNDISARTYQRHTSQWAVGKNADGSGPIGTIVTADEAGHPEDGWRIRTILNDMVVQDGNTRDMIFGIGEVASYLSQVIALRPGDVIATGTPEGVGTSRNPPLFMKPGDTIAVEIDIVGRIENHIVAAADYDRSGPSDRI